MLTKQDIEKSEQLNKEILERKKYIVNKCIEYICEGTKLPTKHTVDIVNEDQWLQRNTKLEPNMWACIIHTKSYKLFESLTFSEKEFLISQFQCAFPNKWLYTEFETEAKLAIDNKKLIFQKEKEKEKAKIRELKQTKQDVAKKLTAKERKILGL